MTSRPAELPKTPRWISTEAGQWAWREHNEWRGSAAQALSVQTRQELLDEAELLRQSHQAGPGAE